MELPSRTPRELRYRAYFRLMDASTVAIGIGAVDYFADAVFQSGLEAFVPAPWIYVIGLPVMFFNFLVPMVLVVARFMRDDYAEGLWRRAMLVFRAQPSSAISSPANGRTGQKPWAATRPAIVNDTTQVLRKKSRAARGVSEQWGAISMRAEGGVIG